MSRMCFRIDVTCLCQGKDLSLLRRSASALQTMDAAASSDNSLYCHRYKSDCQATDTVVKAYIIYITHGRGLNVVTSSVISLLTKRMSQDGLQIKVQSLKFKVSSNFTLAHAQYWIPELPLGTRKWN